MLVPGMETQCGERDEEQGKKLSGKQKRLK